MRLSELINGNGATTNIDIAGLASDSRAVQPGYLFAALAGVNANGSDFVDEAIAHGAVAVLGPPGMPVTGQAVQVVTDRNPRRRLALLAARFFGRQPENLVAVTGTNGKSSVVGFVSQIWRRMGFRAASVGTMGVMAPELIRSLALTTPDPVVLHQALDDLVTRKIDHVALEASSHGLSQFRLDGLRLSAAALTNITRDHLDYHGTAEAYLYAKLRLFGEVMAPGGTAVLYAGDPAYREAAALCWARGHRIISVGGGEGDIRLADHQALVNGQRLTVAYEGHRYPVMLPLIGKFQAMNALTAAALVIAHGGEPGAAFAALSRLTGVPGRLQLAVRLKSGAPIYVDFAHSPDALDTMLRALRRHCRGRLFLVFGCGGDRDRGKRPLMGGIAAALADRVFVTDDNPRSEDAAHIRAQILQACPDAIEVTSRAQAIRTAISELTAEDVLVIAGKGHEQGQLVSGRMWPFNDIEQVREAAHGVAECDDV